ncbi:MAG: hypothetical protein R3242_11125, partial [Akkermansiaceae bacterium]|nr:hypothetical protein [Akkermansiaceae bacterium]
VIIGKSFLHEGGQNPCEAIRAHKPVIVGPHMENFEPLASQLIEEEGVLQATSPKALAEAVEHALDPRKAALLTRNAARVLQVHDGATSRIIELIENS